MNNANAIPRVKDSDILWYFNLSMKVCYCILIKNGRNNGGG